MLLQEAVAGSGVAFAALYDRYESRVFNFCLRLVDSREDARDATQEAFLSVLRRLRSDDDPVLNFSAYLFAAARHESFRANRRRARTDSLEEPPEAGDARAGPSAIETDPERSALLESSQEEVRAANARLPWRYRGVLALRELEGCSYDEIAQILGINRNAVSQLLWRARTKLRDELRIGAVASVVAASDACERAQALISQEQDGELDEPDRAWLEQHLDECGACRTSKAALLEVGASYRAWLPIAAVAGMRPDVLTRAGEIVGADWSAVASVGSTSAGGSAAGSGAATGQFAAGMAAVAVTGAAVIALAVLLPHDDGERPAAQSIPPQASQQKAPTPKPANPKPVQAKPAAAVEAARPARRRADGAVLGATADAAPPTEPPGTEPGPGPPPDHPPASPHDAAPPAPREPVAEPLASPPGPAPPSREGPVASPPGQPRAPEDPVTPQTPSDPAPPSPASECTHQSEGRGPDGCPPGHGGEPPERKDEGGRGPPGDDGPPGRP